MARQPDVRYVQIYNPGSTARKLELLTPQKKKKAVLPKPKIRKEKQRVIYFDPLALCAMAAAGLLLVAMVVGMIQLGTASSQTRELEAQVYQLQQENAALQEEFYGNYDLQAVQQQAREWGMVSSEEVQHVPLNLTIPEVPEEPGFLERVGVFFSELFA